MDRYLLSCFYMLGIMLGAEHVIYKRDSQTLKVSERKVKQSWKAYLMKNWSIAMQEKFTVIQEMLTQSSVRHHRGFTEIILAETLVMSLN